ncbi:PAS domain-containing sensor histidine kinase [filamentous cyanobacterium CCT1]|nr:PAS domain-containing sensor histidine kinase [filamentous cyanobacterium CCT1]PSN77374.1 PAS domain-containing sensor histidine kinase [filamentous cyanobacterium CCP4]
MQTQVESLYNDARQYPNSHSQRLVVTLEELRLAIEELHVAEEELITQNEQLIAAQQLAEVERQRYQQLFEFAPDGYLVTDLNGIVQEANRAAETLLNIQQKFLIGKPLVTYVAQTERANFRALLSQIRSARRVQGCELMVQQRRGEAITAEITVETFSDASGAPVGLRWQIRDISDRKKAEAALAQLQAQNLEMLEADRLRTQFLATVSHELKTPMTAILGFSQVLMGQFNCNQDPRATKMAERIFHNGQHLLSLIENMLNFSRLRANQVELQLETFDLLELINTTIDELQPLVDQKAIALETDLPDEPLMITNDRNRLRQIITNLWSNAIKFTDSGRVTVRVKTLPANRLSLVVQDTGCGISDEDQAYIFQEFWQVHNARSMAQGTGLGLAIVHALVKTMQGSITVESELGRGSQFKVELPQTVKPSRMSFALKS